MKKFSNFLNSLLQDDNSDDISTLRDLFDDDAEWNELKRVHDSMGREERKIFVRFLRAQKTTRSIGASEMALRKHLPQVVGGAVVCNLIVTVLMVTIPEIATLLGLANVVMAFVVILLIGIWFRWN